MYVKCVKYIYSDVINSSVWCVRVCGVCVCMRVCARAHACTISSHVLLLHVCVCKGASACQPVLLTNHCEDDRLTPHLYSFSELTEALIHCVVVTDPGAL